MPCSFHNGNVRYENELSQSFANGNLVETFMFLSETFPFIPGSYEIFQPVDSPAFATAPAAV